MTRPKPSRKRTVTSRILTAAAAALLLVSSAACTRDSNSTATSSGGGGGGGSVPTPKVSGSAVELKAQKVGILNINGSDPGAVLLQTSAEDAVKKLGWTSVAVDAGGDPSKAAAGMSQLVNQKVNAILLDAVDPAAIGSGLQAASEAGIPVVLYGGGGTPSSLVTSVVPNDFTLAALAADYIVNALNGKGKIAIMTTDGIPFAGNRTKLLQLELEQYPDIQVVATHQTDYANYQSDLQSATRNVLQANPDLSAIFATISPYPTPIAAALAQAGATDKVKLVSFYSYPSELKLLQSGGLTAVADADLSQNAYTAVDLLAQKFGKNTDLNSAAQYELPLQYQLITSANPPSASSVTYPIDATAYYEKKWTTEFSNVS